MSVKKRLVTWKESATEAKARIATLERDLTECREALRELVKAVETRRKRQEGGTGFSFMEIDVAVAIRVETSALSAARAILPPDTTGEGEGK